MAYAAGPSRRGFLALVASALSVALGTAPLSRGVAPAAASGSSSDCIVGPISRPESCPDSRRPKAGFTPTTNGCGAAGSELEIPQGFGRADFSPACNAHDLCYSECGSSQWGCDAALHQGVTAACLIYVGVPLVYQACLHQASLYGPAVALFGGAAHHSAQQEACECCTKPGKVWCGPTDACYDTGGECLADCRAGLGYTGKLICGPAPEGKCE